jgi:L-threonylcarbamoyladenylate synthase
LLIVNYQVSLVNRDRLISAIKNGQLGSFPTDTVPALASLPERADLIYRAKQRSQDKPLILMAGKLEDLWEFTQGTATEMEQWQTMASRYLPGGLTLVLPAADRVPQVMNPTASNTIGIRVPAHAIAQEILLATGALATTSANLSGQPALLKMAEINQYFPDVFCLDVEDEPPSLGTPSTVIKWSNSGWEILRQGAVTINN